MRAQDAKPGDRVRCIEATDHHEVGDVLTVRAVVGDVLHFDGSGATAEYFELVSSEREP